LGHPGQRLGDKAVALVVAAVAIAHRNAAVGSDVMDASRLISLISSTKLIIAVHILIPTNREQLQCF
jgi:hypothetical protein